MVPSIEQVAASRQMFAAIVRLTGVILALIAIYQWCYEIEYTLNALFMYPAPSGTPAGQTPSVALQVWNAMSWSSLVLFVPGLIMVLLARRIARILIPLSTQCRCPACEYPLDGISRPECPECGLELTRAFADAPSVDPNSA